MKKLFLFLMLIVSNICFAANVEISVNPINPVVGETFTVTFSIYSESSDEPAISFNPLGAEVVSRGSYGVSTRTTYVNGKLSVERKITVDYELMANAGGEVFLRDIKVEMGGQTYSHPTKRISIYKEALKTPEIFVKAEVSKSELYVNESMLVRYYLYSKHGVSNIEIKKFPQLDNFLKRYHDERVAAQRVEYDGELYNRKVIYTAQLFAQKEGLYTVDPITMIVQYSERSNDPFSGIGFGFSQLRKKTILSEPVKIKVKKLPFENVPSSFTGLVGKHEFELNAIKNKYLVNEPIEISFKVKGPGALELLEAPVILSNANLEELVSNTDLKIDQDFMGMKTFDITYLGRGPVKEGAKKIPFTYFDPDSEKFVTVELDFKGVEVVGQAIAKINESKSNSAPSQAQNSDSPKTFDVKETPAFIPFYKLVNTYRYQSKNILILLLIIFVLITTLRFKEYFSNRAYTPPSVIKIVKTQGVNYSKLFSLLSLIRQKDDKDLKDIINNSKLSKKAKVYFEKLMHDCEKEFQGSSSIQNISVNKKFLAEIEKIIKKK